MLAYEGRVRSYAAVTDPDRLAPMVASLCDRFNRCYAAWLTPGAAVVRYEELTGDLDQLVERLARALELPGPARAGARLPHVLGPARWDDEPAVVVEVDFDDRRPRTPLPSSLVEVVTERIDWPLMAPYRYAPMAF
jgi:hypothetical protein